jgi:methionyl-tRNA synthetase
MLDPLPIAGDLGVDALRYFLLREVPLGADGDFSHPALLGRYNAELANDLGNLVNRTLGMADKYFGSNLPESPCAHLQEAAERLPDEVVRAVDGFAPATALAAIWSLVRDCNANIDHQAPWNASTERRAEILSGVLEAIRFIGNLLDPFLPERAAEIRRQIGLPGPASWPTWRASAAWRLEKGTPLFPRIDDDRRAELLARWTPRPPKAASPTPEPSEEALVSYDEFSRLDLRVARVVSAEPVPKAKKLLKLVVDLGSSQRQVVAGIAEAYRPEELVGKKVILLANLAPATIRGVTSQGLIRAAGDALVLALSGLDRDTPVGTMVG